MWFTFLQWRLCLGNWLSGAAWFSQYIIRQYIAAIIQWRRNDARRCSILRTGGPEIPFPGIVSVRFPRPRACPLWGFGLFCSIFGGRWWTIRCPWRREMIDDRRSTCVMEWSDGMWMRLERNDRPMVDYGWVARNGKWFEAWEKSSSISLIVSEIDN